MNNQQEETVPFKPPLGFRFKPSNTDLILEYLLPKIKNSKLSYNGIFVNGDPDLYSDVPWNLIKKEDPFEFNYSGKNIIRSFHVFTWAKRTDSKSSRFSRTVQDHGTWKGETGEKEVYMVRNVDGVKREVQIGFDKLFKFVPNHKGDELRKIYGDWNMHEYSLKVDSFKELQGYIIHPDKELVICHVKQTIPKELVQPVGLAIMKFGMSITYEDLLQRIVRVHGSFMSYEEVLQYTNDENRLLALFRWLLV